MKLLISLTFIVVTALAVEQENPKKLPFETNRNAESLIQQKVNYENKAKSPASASKAVAADVNSSTQTTQSKSTEKGSTTAPEAQPPEASAADSQLVVCKSGSETRNIEIRKKGSGCEVTYTKKGEAKVIAQQRLGNLRCDHVFQDLQSKLTKGGFVCEAK